VNWVFWYVFWNVISSKQVFKKTDKIIWGNDIKWCKIIKTDGILNKKILSLYKYYPNYIQLCLWLKTASYTNWLWIIYLWKTKKIKDEKMILKHELVHYNSIYWRIINPIKIIEYKNNSNYVLSWLNYICKKYNWKILNNYCIENKFIEKRYLWWYFDELLAYQTEKILYNVKNNKIIQNININKKIYRNMNINDKKIIFRILSIFKK